jgi:hypothetical protein
MQTSSQRRRLMLAGTIIVIALFGVLWWVMPASGG